MTLLLAIALAAGGSSKICSPTDKASCLQIVVKGEPVPFTGTLFTPRGVAKSKAKAEHCDARVEMEIGESNELWDIKLQLEQGKRTNDKETAALREDLLRGNLEEALKQRDVPIVEHPVFVATVTAVVVSVVYALATYGAGQLGGSQ